MFNKMSDWCMAKDYNGAECFIDGSRPLIAETKFADIIISGIPDKNEVIIGVYPGGDMCDYFFEGNVETKKIAEQIGNDIEKYINSNENSQMFANGCFKEFFSGLNITSIRTQALAEESEDSGDLKTPEFIKAFFCLSRQNYYNANQLEKGIADVVTFGNFATDGKGIEYELSMQWIVLENEKHASPQLCIFNDAFKAIEEHAELFRELPLYHKMNFTPVQFSEILLRLGYKDISDKKLE